VVILGFQAVRSAALAISVFDFFKDENSSEALDITQFWSHSIAVAVISKVLAAEVKINQQEEAFIVGLLHDVGKLIEKCYFAPDFDEVWRVVSEQHLTWYACEKELFQVNHSIIGKVVFRSWHFPGSVVEAVQYHHMPQSASKFPQLTALVHVADYLSYKFDLGAPGSYPPECDPAALKLLNLTLPQAVKLKDTINSELEHSMGILNLIS